ncbi:MAG: FG-GAP-like repeat-containing protein [candidate division KSB1 bacterium]|nr:FG-GAP-like repeat-containing protein [candidate division KSB1 bacterium]
MKKTSTIAAMVGCFMLLLMGSAGAQQFIAQGFHKELGVHQFDPDHQTCLDEVHATYDFDHDGKLEFFVLTDESQPNGPYAELDDGACVYLYEATGKDTYELIWAFRDTSLATGAASFPTCGVTDMDGDGWHELLIGIPYGAGYPTPDGNPARLYVFEGSPSGLPSWDSPTATWNFEAKPGTNTRPAGMAAADIDGDGVAEVACAFRNFSSATKNDALMIFSLLGEFAGPFTQFKIEVMDTTTDVNSIYDAAIADIDNDGKLEALFPSYSKDLFVFYEGNGPDNYTYHTVLGGDLVWAAIHGTVNVDLDGDGKNEVVSGDNRGYFGFIGDVTNLATIGADNLFQVGMASPNGTRGLTAGDYDGDGKTDIFVGGNWSGKVFRIEYVSGDKADSTSYTWEMIYQYPPDTAEARVYDVCFPGDNKNFWQTGNNTVHDMDGDGEPELLIAHETGDPDTQDWLMLIEGKGVTAVEIIPGAQVLKSFKLYQNHPNPFNPTTAIVYEMPRAEYVTVRIYNSMGRLVRTLVENKLMPAGSHEVVWDATDDTGQSLPSGLYLCHVKMGSLSLTRHMTLVR